MPRPSPGQRWISTSEPSLGLGIVHTFDGSKVEIHYPVSEEKRIYALESAPIVRVVFNPGDVIADRDGHHLTVERVTIRNEIITYHGSGWELDENGLQDSVCFIRPERRLLAAMTDPPRDFDMRFLALEWNSRIRQSPARGFTGARMDLITHQLAIIAETSARLYPRVLLADEVGLGKTIEACLILHRLHHSGRAARVLILVPETLIHQWFIELLRRFNLLFAIFDEDRCQSIEAHDGECNPFLDSQLILASVGFLSESGIRSEQARHAGFDLLIVDEAHHLEWSPDNISNEYLMVESLAVGIPSLLLLTATPQFSGPAGHFARLRLLDPERYGELDDFLEEMRAYATLAEVVEVLKNGGIPGNIDAFTDRSPRLAAHLADLRAGISAARDHLVSALIDSFGTGRVLFRNTRDQLNGFPERQPHLYPLSNGSSPYVWLADLLRSLPESEKILLITGSPEAAIVTQVRLLAIIRVESALFHEELSLLQRDRNAAWFADPEGARILICSEIGSEGRNFQFARHLVLFGLPRDPELLEQRIGRLDRIGQTGTIEIHVPYGVNSQSGYQARWLHEGLDAFTSPLKGAATLAATLLPELDALVGGEEKDFDAFLMRSKTLKEEVAREIGRGHDRLLGLGSPNAEQAAGLLSAIQAADRDRAFERFAVRLFDHLGLDVGDLFHRSYHFHRGQRHSEAFADLPEEGLAVTFDRKTALAREDLDFLTMDHPLLLGAFEHFLDSESGNASFARWRTGDGKAILLECIFVLEVPAPTRLHLDRFLPPTVLRVTVDHQGRPFTDNIPSAALLAGDSRPLVGQESFRMDLFPKMLEAARLLAASSAEVPGIRAHQLAAETFNVEIERLEDLAIRNHQVTASECAALRNTRDETLHALANPRIRLDALRLIWRSEELHRI